MKKSIKIFIIAIFLVSNFLVGSQAMAVNATEPPTDKTIYLKDTNSDTKAEQTRWYFRTIDGVQQKRLWSVTYGYWKTDWINI